MQGLKYRIVCAALVAITAPALAQYGNANQAPPNGQQNGPQEGHPHGPPPEATAACKGKAEGSKVQFTGRRGEQVSGVCRKLREAMAAVPAGGMPPPPPPASGK